MQPVFAPDVAAARAAGRPIVALESTIIAHGLPWPDNLAIARDLEATVRAAGAVPATIAAGYPRLPEFQSLVRELDPERVFVSDQARRLSL